MDHHQGNRLTPTDWETMSRRLTAAVAGWVTSTNERRYTVKPIDAETLRRLALASIGCTAADMRDAELDSIDAHIAAEYIGGTFKPTAAAWHRITRVAGPACIRCQRTLTPEDPAVTTLGPRCRKCWTS